MTNKLKILNFFWKPETDQKFEETDKKTGNWPTYWKFITFLKTENGPIICRNGLKKKETNQLTKNVQLFFKPETNLKYAEMDRKKSKLTEINNFFQTHETNLKYAESV